MGSYKEIFFSRYVEKSQFIAEINNEPPYDNKIYAENMKKLEGLVLVKFTQVSSFWFFSTNYKKRYHNILIKSLRSHSNHFPKGCYG